MIDGNDWYAVEGSTYCCIRNDERVIADMRTVNGVFNRKDTCIIAHASDMHKLLTQIQANGWVDGEDYKSITRILGTIKAEV